MGSTFNPHILVEKLAKLNDSQTSIETLSHWCIFHMHKAKQVVETWARQFHSSPREQKLAFLYLANDILQNSRRKGIEFVGEFWKVLPDALRDVIENGDDFGRNSVLRLIGIWEERKVFGSRSQMLKEELVGRHAEKSNRNGKNLGLKLQHPGGTTLDKIVSSYQVVYGGQLDENVILSKCRNAISCLEKVDKEPGGDISSGCLLGAAFMEEVKGQHAILRECIEQLTAVESSRANLVSFMREALREQELKLEEIRSQLQVAQSQSEHFHQLIDCNNEAQLPEQVSKEFHASTAPQSFVSAEKDQAAPVMYNEPQMSYPKQSGPINEGKYAAVAAKLTSSTSSAHMLSCVLSSLTSEGVIGNPVKDSSGDKPPDKRPKLANDQSYVSPQNYLQPPAPHFTPPESLPQNVMTTSQQLTQNEPPPPPPSCSPPPLPPLPPMPVAYPFPPYMQSVVSVNGEEFTYGMAQQLPPPFAGYPPMTAPVSGISSFSTPVTAPVTGISPFPGNPPVTAPVTGISPFSIPPPNPYHSFQAPDGTFYNQPPSVPTVPISRQ